MKETLFNIRRSLENGTDTVRGDSTRAESRLMYTFPEAARRLNISRSTIYLLIDAGRLKPVHVGRSARFTATELERFVADLEREVQ